MYAQPTFSRNDTRGKIFSGGCLGGYTFGFNGQMKDDELHGEGNAYAFEYRIHDARIGRFLSVDPLAPEYPWNSTYAFAENKVIWAKDLEGAELSFATDAITNYILGQVDASDIDQGLKNAIGAAIGTFQFTTAMADPVRMGIDQLAMTFQALETGLPVILQASRDGITLADLKALGVAHPVGQIIAGKMEQIRIIQDGGAEGYKEGAKLTLEVITIFMAAKGAFAKSKNTKTPAVSQPEAPPAAKATPEIAPIAKATPEISPAAKATPEITPKVQSNIAKNVRKMSANDIGDFLKAGEDWHKGSAKKDFLKQFKKELRGDTNADFYFDKTTKEVFLKSNKSGNWINTGLKFE